MKTIDILRVELPSGAGAYSGSGLWVDDAGTDYKTIHRPLPTMDGIPNVDGRHFGFACWETFWQWFGTGINSLHKNGFVLSVYRVARHHVSFGKYQVVFRRERAEKIETIPI